MTSDNQSKADRSSRQAKIDAAGPKPSKARPVLIATVVLVTLLALGAAVFFGSRSSAPDASPAASGSADYPPSATGPEGGISVNADKVQENTPRLDVYEDFQCPACQQIERALGPTIKQMADAGEVQVAAVGAAEPKSRTRVCPLTGRRAVHWTAVTSIAARQRSASGGRRTRGYRLRCRSVLFHRTGRS